MLHIRALGQYEELNACLSACVAQDDYYTCAENCRGRYTPAPSTPSSVPASQFLTPAAATTALLLNQQYRQPVAVSQPPATSYLPYVIGGVALLAVVMMVGK